MRSFSVRDLTIAAMVAALYTVMGYFANIFGLNFLVFQCRFAEALTVLPFLFPAAAPGLVVGCFLTNLLSPFGPLDWLFGTLATAIAAWLTMKMPRWYLAALPPILVNALILSPMWAWTEVGAVNSAFWTACGWNALTYIPAEALVCWVLGTPLLKLLPKISVLKPPCARRLRLLLYKKERRRDTKCHAAGFFIRDAAGV